LPAIYFQKKFVDEGGLMSYGADYYDLYRRAAVYVDKILKRTKPADLPVEQPMKFELIITNREPDRPDDPAECVGAGRQSDQVKYIVRRAINRLAGLVSIPFALVGRPICLLFA